MADMDLKKISAWQSEIVNDLDTVLEGVFDGELDTYIETLEGGGQFLDGVSMMTEGSEVFGHEFISKSPKLLSLDEIASQAQGVFQSLQGAFDKFMKMHEDDEKLNKLIKPVYDKVNELYFKWGDRRA